MPDKPSYLGLLNAISLAEGEAECYLNEWACVTPYDDVRQVLTTVALREGEHSKAFAKRMCELGFAVQPRERDTESKLAIARSRDLTDREKFEKLQVGQEDQVNGPDIFSRMFEDKSIDIETGRLLGRYVCEERDSGRMLRACYLELCRREGATSGDVEARLSRIECLLEQVLANR